MRQKHVAAYFRWPDRAERRACRARRRPRRPDRFRLPGTDVDAVGDGRRQRLSAVAPRWRDARGGIATNNCDAGVPGAWRLRQSLSAAALGRYAYARFDRPRPGDRTGATAAR